MSYESAKTSTNLGSGETMTSEMPSQSAANNFYTNNNNNNNRSQAMMMNPMMAGGNYYNGPPQGPPSQTAQMPNRSMYQSYQSGVPPPSHPQHHQVSSSYPSKDGGLSTSANNDTNANDSITASHDQHQQQAGNLGMQAGPNAAGNGGYNNPAMMPPPHPQSKQQAYANYSQQQQQQSGDMYTRTSVNPVASTYMPPYPQYPTGGTANMNPRSPATNANVYRPPYSSGSPYQNGVASSSPSGSSGKPGSRAQQLSPKRSNPQPTTPPQQPRYQNPYPPYANGPVGYKPSGSNGYAPQQQQPTPPPQQQQQQQQGTPWPPQSSQREATTPSLASSTGDSDSNSSNASQQTASYPSSAMTNGPTSTAYPTMPSNPYNNPGGMNDPNNTSNNISSHSYIDQQYPNMIPPSNYGYPPQHMNPYGTHPQQQPPVHPLHSGTTSTDFRPSLVQSMDDENNLYRNKAPSSIIMDQQSHSLSTSQSQSIPSSSTNGPKSPSGTSMSSYVPDDADSSNSSFADSPPPSHEKGPSKRKLSSTTSSSHGTPAEVFSKLREMGDEAERQERNIFVDRLQKLWEENQIVCRNLPSISKQTIDLYHLYTCVREQNGFQEFSKVAKNRHWRDIASKLKIPNSSSAAFNVKQKYINLKLFHYECKYDRGGINPEPILAEIEKQQGKRPKTPKKGSSGSGTAANNSINENANDSKINPSYPPQAANPQAQNPMLQTQLPAQGQPALDSYRGYPPQGHPQQSYRPMPMHPYGSTGNDMPASYDPSSGGQIVYGNPEMDYQRTGYPPGQPGQPPQMMKPMGSGYSMSPQNPQGPQPPPGPMQQQHRPPGPYPTIASKPQQPQQMVPSMTSEYNGQQPPTHGGGPTNQQIPPMPGGPQQTYHYQPQQSMINTYPPNAGYPPQRPPMMAGGPLSSQPHDEYLSRQVPPNQTCQSSTQSHYPYKRPENSTTDASAVDHQDPHKGNKLLINQLRSSTSNTSNVPNSTPISILTSTTAGISPATINATVTPSSAPAAHFPPNSVEATTVPLKLKRKKLTAKDVTPVDPWKLMMSLRGGLLAETTWALDTINVMLSDDQTHTHFRLKQMPGLLPAIVDIYMKCLTQLFDEFKTSPTNIEYQQPSLDELNGSSHLTCTTRKKADYRQHDSIIYRVESNYLNKYRRKYQKQQSIVYDQIYDEHGNEKLNPTEALDLQNTDDLCYIRTHFDPLRPDDSFFENIYYGRSTDDNSINHKSNDCDQESMKNGDLSSRKRHKTSEGDMSIDCVNTVENDNKRRRYNSDPSTEISDSNKEFLERYKRRFEFDERHSYELYPGIHHSKSSLTKQSIDSKHTDFDSCANSSEQQENVSSLFTYHSLVYDQICARCTCVSSILRNLSFIMGNDLELVKCKTLIGLLARLLLLRHGINHNHASDSQSTPDETVNPDQVKTDELKSSPSFSWAECILNVRENTLVTLANIAGALVLDTFDSDLLYTLIDGLLHWSTCYSGEAIDSLHSSILSAQRLSIEILTKLSVHEMNMDFILATPPFYRIVSLFHVLTDWLIVDEINGVFSNWHPTSITSSSHFYPNSSRPQTHTQREFAVVLLNALTRCDPLATNVIARIPYAISLLINFLEDYEIKTNELMARYGPDYVIRLTTQPSTIPNAEQMLFTTGDMLKRAATCLLSIVSYADNIKVMKRYEDRILNLSISHVIDSNVGRVLTDVLHYCSLHNS